MFYLNRQLEAIVRIAESLAKMRLEPFAYERDVDEALRLFQVSTLDAAMSGSLTGMIWGTVIFTPLLPFVIAGICLMNFCSTGPPCTVLYIIILSVLGDEDPVSKYK